MSPAATKEPTEQGIDTVCVGRQAIFDRNLEVYAYELLYRSDAGDQCANFTDGDLATSSTLLNSFIEIGIDRLTNGRKTFINMTRSFFIDHPPIPFDKGNVVLEILEDIPVDQPLIDAVKNLSEQGYWVAIDDYLFEKKWEPLLPHVKLVKVEVTEDNMTQMATKVAELKKHPVTLLAEKVETREQYQALREVGFDLFQGYFFARPNIVKQARLKENNAVAIQLIAKLNDEDAEIEDISKLISQDPALSFKTLRFINSAATSTTRTIESIRQAVVLMGLKQIRAWATLFAMSSNYKGPDELLNLGLMRANLCQNLSKSIGMGAPETAYTVGLLSVLDALMSMTMTELLQQIPLPDVIKHAIVQQQGDYGEILAFAIKMEQGSIETSNKFNIKPSELQEIFTSSSESSFAALKSLGD